MYPNFRDNAGASHMQIMQKSRLHVHEALLKQELKQ